MKGLIRLLEERARQAPPAGRRRWGRLGAAFVILSFIALGVLVPEVRKPGNGQHDEILSDDFSKQAGWTVSDDPLHSASVVSGAYRIQLGWPNDALESFRYAKGGSWKSVIVKAEAWGRGLDAVFGVSCLASVHPARYYVFAIWPTMHFYFIIRLDSSFARPNAFLNGDYLARGTDEDGVIRASEKNEIRGQCIGNGPRAKLVMFVNGTKLIEISDAEGLGTFRGGGLVAYSRILLVDVRFDNFELRRA
jgi:hypothetical protein